MRRRIILAVALLAALSTVGTSQEGPSDRQNEEERIGELWFSVQSLVGATGVRVLVEEIETDEIADLTLVWPLTLTVLRSFEKRLKPHR